MSKIRILILIGTLLTLLVASFFYWLDGLNIQMRERLAGGWFLPPVEIYSAGEWLAPGQKRPSSEWARLMQHLDFRKRDATQPLRERDFTDLDQNQCRELMGEKIPENTTKCYVTKSDAKSELGSLIVARNDDDVIQGLFGLETLEPIAKRELSAELFAQFYGEQPMLRRIVEVSQIPLFCLQGVTAIEDAKFLEHQGVSWTGMARAVYRNLIARRYEQGGSTITQQLVKNYFLTAEKTVTRKFKELFMAMLLESQLDKNQIIEAYLNVIYMGQSGPFQVRGIGAAAQHYFGKKLEDLELGDCALLAAVVNSPGLYNPWTQPARAKERRNLVLKKMLEHKMIDQNQFDEIAKTNVSVVSAQELPEPAPYFIDTVRRELDKLSIDPSAGLKIYTALVPSAQRAAHESIRRGLQNLEATIQKKNKSKKKLTPLEAAIVAVDVDTGRIFALVGGRDYKMTQYNRAIQSQRQVGSLMKPIVYLTALESRNSDGSPFTPLTILKDEPFTHKYEGQIWEPRNYDNKTRGEVPLFYALKESLNIPTAQLALQVGLSNIIDLARRIGVTSHLDPVPSLSLGAFEMTPLEVAQVYSNFARMGAHLPIGVIQRVETLGGQLLFQAETKSEQRVASENVAILIGMLKQTLESGTGKVVRLLGYDKPAAGKTGTTSDTKDAWFGGFTPHLAVVVWVGRDDNSPHDLTGASGAAPIWADFMKQISVLDSGEDFKYPTTVQESSFMVDVPSKEKDSPEHVTEEFRLVTLPK